MNSELLTVIGGSDWFHCIMHWLDKREPHSEKSLSLSLPLWVQRRSFNLVLLHHVASLPCQKMLQCNQLQYSHHLTVYPEILIALVCIA